MENVELLLKVEGDGTIKAAINAEGHEDDGAEGSWKLDSDPLLQRIAETFDLLLRRGAITRSDEMVVLGMLLHRMVLGQGEAKSFFEKALDVAQQDRLRVQLSFDSQLDDLASLPWEYLYLPASETVPGYFFSTNAQLVLSRFIPSGAGRPKMTEAPEPPLRILVIPAQPTGLPPIAADELIDAISKTSEKYPIVLDRLDSPTIGEFLDRLGDEARPVHVVHFIGHGKYEDKRYKLAFLSEASKPEWVDAQTFAQYFKDTNATPKLVFLHLCEAEEDIAANFARLAPPLLQRNVPHVVAMQHPMPNLAGVSFTKYFYDALGKGQPIDHAVQIARWRINIKNPELADTRVWGTPVLYMRSRGGPLVKSAGKGTTVTGQMGGSEQSDTGQFLPVPDVPWPDATEHIAPTDREGP